MIVFDDGDNNEPLVGPDEVDEEEGEWLDGLRRAGLPVRTGDTVLQPTSRRLSAPTAALVAESWAPSTRVAYEASWARFDGWCRATRRAEPLDADATVVADYVAFHVQCGLSIAYLERNLAAITAVFEMADRISPARHPIVRRAVAGARRVRGSGQRQAAPLQLDELRRIITGMAIVAGKPGHDLVIRRDRALLLTGWYGALRSAELVALDADDVTFTGDPDRGTGGMLLRLRAAKGDPEREAQWVAIPYSQRISACPVRTMMFLHRQQRTGPLFRKIDRHGRQHDRIHPTAASTILRRHITAVLGIDPEPYSSHSLRAGWVTHARTTGLQDLDIARHTRHKDQQMLHVYDRPANLLATPTGTSMGEW